MGSPLVVMDKNNSKPSGIITERDLARHVCAEGINSRDVLVEKVMSAPIVTIDPDSPIEVAADNMLHNKVRHLVITDTEGKALGIVTPTDFSKALKGNIDRDEVNAIILRAIQEDEGYA
ncbi:MAG: hypothetical protein DA330_00180 [Nitrososphaera sp.]|nr:hypothetical protein [Nitrososphaera sp.]